MSEQEAVTPQEAQSSPLIKDIYSSPPNLEERQSIEQKLRFYEVNDAAVFDEVQKITSDDKIAEAKIQDILGNHLQVLARDIWKQFDPSNFQKAA